MDSPEEDWLHQWLTTLNLSEYQATFIQYGLNVPERLKSVVDREQLKAIGVTKMGHLNRLFRAIEKLKSDSFEGSVSQASEGNLEIVNPSPPLPPVDIVTNHSPGKLK